MSVPKNMAVSQTFQKRFVKVLKLNGNCLGVLFRMTKDKDVNQLSSQKVKRLRPLRFM